MRLLKFIVGLLLLKRLPFGFAGRWMVRLAVWAALGYSLYRKLNPPASISRASLISPSPSGWAPAASTSPTWTATSAVPSSPENITIPRNDIVAEELVVEIDIAPDPADEGAMAHEFLFVSTDDPIGEEELTVVEVEVDQAEAPVAWVRGDGTENCPNAFPVKAKASSLIYHTLESRSYHMTIPDVCFASATDAEAADTGRPCGRVFRSAMSQSL